MSIKTLPQLVTMLELYKNPYIITRYTGIDWMNYINYHPRNINTFDLSKNLSLISYQDTSNFPYKIYKNDFIHILEGQILIDDYNRVNINFLKENNHFSLCKGSHFYNSFLHYKSN